MMQNFANQLTVAGMCNKSLRYMMQALWEYCCCWHSCYQLI